MKVIQMLDYALEKYSHLCIFGTFGFVIRLFLALEFLKSIDCTLQCLRDLQYLIHYHDSVILKIIIFLWRIFTGRVQAPYIGVVPVDLHHLKE